MLDANDNQIGQLFEDSVGLALLRRFVRGAWLPQNYDLTVGGTWVADLKQNFHLFRYELNLDFSMDISHQLDRRYRHRCRNLLAAIEGKQNTE